MRLFALIGSIAMLIVPFAYTSFSLGDAASTTTWLALLWYSGEFTVFGISQEGNETFQLDWFEDGGTFESLFFGDLYIVGIIIFALLIVNIAISAISSEKKNKNAPAIILLISGIGLLLLRLIYLGDNDLSFYSKQESFLVDRVYFEIPIGFLLSLVFSILDFQN